MQVMRLFVGLEVPEADLRRLVERSYGDTFRDVLTTPLKPLVRFCSAFTCWALGLTSLLRCV